MGLRKGQKELVENYTGGFCAVPAIPGGGKTYCLTMWAVETISKGLHKPGKLLIVTYMNSAVNNFKRRIAEELSRRGMAGCRDYQVSTIHSLCLQIIKERPDLLNAGEDFEIVDDTTRSRLMNHSVEEWKARNPVRFAAFLEDSGAAGAKLEKLYETWTDKLSYIVSQTAVGSFKTRGLDPTALEALCRNLKTDSLLKCAAEVYSIYDNKLKMQGYFDFDDMLHNAARLLKEDKTLLAAYRRKYSFVCEDEAQDSNLIQNEILTLIAEGNLLRVGDSNQAICGTFTSSDFRYFKDFCQQPGTVKYSITQSSRSSRAIIDLANYFVKNITEGHPVDECRSCLLPQYIEPVGPDDAFSNPATPENGIQTAILGSWEEEAAAVVNQAAYVIRKLPEKTMAILVPTGWKMELIVNLLETRHVPFDLLDSTMGSRSKVLKKMGRLLEFISNPGSIEKLTAVFEECFPEELEVLRAAVGEDTGTEGLLYPGDGEGFSVELPGNLGVKLQLIRDLLDYPVIKPEKLILYMAELMEFCREEKAIAVRVAEETNRMITREPGWHLGMLAVELLSPRNPFTHFAGAIWDLKGYQPEPGRVTVSTYHKAKGLEWDVVFLTGLNNSDFPVRFTDKFIGEYWFLKQEYKNPQAILKAELCKALGEEIHVDPVRESKLETIAERARLLYVGITRAREYLFLSGVLQNQGKRNEVLPSGYLLELKKYLQVRNTEVADEVS